MFVTVLAFLLFGTSFAAVVALILRSRFHRLHRVDPAVATDAPMTWMLDPRLPARLHRRLARVGTVATTVIEAHTAKIRRGRRGGPSPLVLTARQLRDHAVSLDLQVARLAVLAPSARRQPLAELVASIGEVEAAAAHLATVSAQLSAPTELAGNEPTLVEIGHRLAHLSDAHRELDDLDRAAGLRSGTAQVDATRVDQSPTDPTRVAVTSTVRDIARGLRRGAAVTDGQNSATSR